MNYAEQVRIVNRLSGLLDLKAIQLTMNHYGITEFETYADSEYNDEGGSYLYTSYIEMKESEALNMIQIMRSEGVKFDDEDGPLEEFESACDYINTNIYGVMNELNVFEPGETYKISA